MSNPSGQNSRDLPLWLINAATLFICLHFLAIGALVLAAASGPWPVRVEGNLLESTSPGPKFAEELTKGLGPKYLEPLRLSSNYHFSSNRPLAPSVYLEVRLTNSTGKVTTMKFPPDAGNPWLQHRYGLLALALGDDQPLQTPRGEMIQAKGEKVPTVTFWDNSDPKLWKLREAPEHLVKDLVKDRPAVRPSDWSLLLVRSYQRYLRKEYDAASVEIIRHSKDPVMPAYMYGGAPEGAFGELVCSFGAAP